MYTVEQAVRIALLENTSITEDAIKSVVAAVSEMVAHPVATVIGRLGDQLRVGWLLPEGVEVGAMLYTAPPVPSDDIVTVASVIGEPTYWVIERAGHPISGTHYKTVADSHSSMGCTVTPFVPRLKS